MFQPNNAQAHPRLIGRFTKFRAPPAMALHKGHDMEWTIWPAPWRLCNPLASLSLALPGGVP